MSEIPATPQYLTEAIEAPPATPGENRIDCAQEVLHAYTALMKASARERDAFEQAARIYQARNPGAPAEAARRAVAIIICRKP